MDVCSTDIGIMYACGMRQGQRQIVPLSCGGVEVGPQERETQEEVSWSPERIGTLALTVRPLSHSPYTRSTQSTLTSGACWVTGGSEKVTAHSQTSRQAECFIEQFRLD